MSAPNSSDRDFIYSVAREINSSLDLDAVLGRVLALAKEKLGANRASLLLMDEHGIPEDLLVSLGDSMVFHDPDKAEDLYEHGLAGMVARERNPVLVTDSSKDPRWMTRPDDNIEVTGAKSAVVAPLVTQDELIGVMSLVAPGVNKFGPTEYELALTIASMSATAVHNACLYEALQQSQKRYKELFDRCNSILLVTDMKGNIQELNHSAEKALGLNLERSDLPNLFDLLYLKRGAALPDLENIIPYEILPIEASLKSRTKDAISVEGTVQKTSFRKEDMLDWDLQDVSARLELETMKDDLASMVYHDLRSPLANILSSIEMITCDLTPEESEKYSTMLDIATRSTRRVESLVNSLLGVYKLEKGQTIVTKEISDPESIVQVAVEITRPRASHRGISLNYSSDSMSGMISVDRDMIRRVVSNLIENALRFTPAGGKIDVGLIDGEQDVRFYVKDNGVGISDEDKKHIFEKFFQSERNGKHQSLGLGLAFCKMAVEAHGGRIWVEDNHDKGSIFQFSLPKTISCVQIEGKTTGA